MTAVITSRLGTRLAVFPVTHCRLCDQDTPHSPVVGCLVCDHRARAALLPPDADTIGAPF